MPHFGAENPLAQPVLFGMLAPSFVEPIRPVRPSPHRPQSLKVHAMKESAKKSTTKISSRKADNLKPAKPKAAGKPAVQALFPTMKSGNKKPTAKKKELEIPAILLEGDDSPASAASGPGSKYALTVDLKPGSDTADLGELPDGYGTRSLILTARDPHWLYAFWDFTNVQLREANKASRDGHLIIRTFTSSDQNLISETHVHPESKNWFLSVNSGARGYVAELGHYNAKGKWTSLSKSSPVHTPSTDLAEESDAEFASLPVEVPFQQLLSLIEGVIPEDIPLLEALQQLRAEGHEGLPEAAQFTGAKTGTSPAVWTPSQERALAEVITLDEVRRVWVGSHEITELVRKQLVGDLSSASAADKSGSAGSISSLGASSPLGGMPEQHDFWFNVNAELIVYGSTEPDAKVTIGGRQIKLREDGSFSYRFALPDGNYDLPAQATSARGDDSRSAVMSFGRATSYAGNVGAHAQDAALQTPDPDHVS
jgi:hypothetical protein